MPKQVRDLKYFLLCARRPDAKAIRIKTNKDNTKFKVRCSKYLYSLTLREADKINKLKQSLPPHLNVEQIVKKKIKPAKK